ncbi:hypothetical protein B0F90DRAFT_1305897 [Multifurca ochricompacta]|uniref:Uncharacterized protein n=1 Tax=Multifurca ochricompacta TaxID=376703 RepID=A0AAD4QPR6_9AGAM|nr:hypothetical protein B0F90DRAFT_1305897 [Multifurca ochricompacta]
MKERERIDLLATLPVELLYEIQYYAVSGALPLASQRLYRIFKRAPLIVHAEYLLGRHIDEPETHCIITHALCFPLCTPAVLDALLQRPDCTPIPSTPPELPRRLFRKLSASGAEVLPLLRFLYTSPRLPRPPDANSHGGYPLARATLAGAVPLVRNKRRDLSLVRLLVEPPEPPLEERRAGKRRRLLDRVQVNSWMLKLAVRCGAQDIAEYLMNEKGCVPDLRTLSFLSTVNP